MRVYIMRCVLANANFCAVNIGKYYHNYQAKYQ